MISDYPDLAAPPKPNSAFWAAELNVPRAAYLAFRASRTTAYYGKLLTVAAVAVVCTLAFTATTNAWGYAVLALIVCWLLWAAGRLARACLKAKWPQLGIDYSVRYVLGDDGVVRREPDGWQLDELRALTGRADDGSAR